MSCAGFRFSIRSRKCGSELELILLQPLQSTTLEARLHNSYRSDQDMLNFLKTFLICTFQCLLRMERTARMLYARDQLTRALDRKELTLRLNRSSQDWRN